MVGTQPVAYAELVGDDATDRTRRFQLLPEIADDDPQIFNTGVFVCCSRDRQDPIVGDDATDMTRQDRQDIMFLAGKV